MATVWHASDIIKQAYVLAQIWDPGEEQPGDEAQEGLLYLNTLIDEWSQMGTYIPAYETLIQPITQGNYLYSITPQITDGLEAHITDTNNTVHNLREANLQQFNLFNFTNLQCRPDYYYLEVDINNISTNTNLYFYPVPDASYTATLFVKQVLPEFTYSSVILNLPLSYYKALKYQLSRDLADVYGTVLSARFDKEYERVIANLQAANRKDMSVQVSNQFNTFRRFRPWNIYVG